MLFNNNNSNEPIGIINNPVIFSPFVQQYIQGGSPIPPESHFRITDSGVFRITDINDNIRITDI